MADTTGLWLAFHMPWFVTWLILACHCKKYECNRTESFLAVWLIWGSFASTTFSGWRNKQNTDDPLFWICIGSMSCICLVHAALVNTKYYGKDFANWQTRLALVVWCATSSGLMGILAGSITSSDGDRSSSDALASLFEEAISLATNTVTGNIYYLIFFVPLSSLIFWIKYENGIRKRYARHDEKSHCTLPRLLTPEDYPSVQKTKLHSQGIASVIIVFILAFVFLAILDGVGVSVDAVAEFMRYLTLGMGWAFRDELGSVLSGFSLQFNTDLEPGDLLFLQGEYQIIQEIGITHMRCQLVEKQEVTIMGRVYEKGLRHIPNNRFGAEKFDRWKPRPE